MEKIIKNFGGWLNESTDLDDITLNNVGGPEGIDNTPIPDDYTLPQLMDMLEMPGLGEADKAKIEAAINKKKSTGSEPSTEAPAH